MRLSQRSGVGSRTASTSNQSSKPELVLAPVRGTAARHLPGRVAAAPAAPEPSNASVAPNPPKAQDSANRNNAVPAPASAASPAAGGKHPKMAALDGCEATAIMAYALSEISFIYPITPSTPMGELADAWSAEGRKNIWGAPLSVTEMESETGAAGAVHGALAAGAMATTFTCSQGLLLMIPNMYKIAGELMPCVLHVTARAIAKHALSIFGDHQDVMAVRQTGWGMLCSSSVQEAHDMALITHLATLRASVPFVHFFDGFRTSHEINKIELIDQEHVKKLVEQPIYKAAIQHHRDRALNPTHPGQRGTAQGPEVWFQNAEAANPFYQMLPDHVVAAMNEVGAVTGRKYRPFDYLGHPQADRVIVVMGSGCEVVEEAVTHLTAQGQRVGMIKVRMFRPWSAAHLLAVMPDTVKTITVLDRTKESGAMADPLYLDVVASLVDADKLSGRKLLSGRYGLASKDFTPAMAIAVFNNMVAVRPRHKFTVGIVDDLTNLSLPMLPEINTLPKGTRQFMFWGMGSDGTVGANKEAIKIIAENTPLYTQAYFSYDAHKSGGVTVSHLRCGPERICAPYLVDKADYMAVSHQSYITKYDIVSKVAPGGVLVLNTTFTSVEKLERFLPDPVKRKIAEQKIQLFVIDARAVANAVGLGKHVNMILQSVFFSLSGVLPTEKALSLLKKSIEKAYKKKGPAVIAKNHAAVDQSLSTLVHIEVPSSWAKLETPVVAINTPKKTEALTNSRLHFIEEVVKPMLALEGDRLPVSVFAPGDGFVPPGTTVVERRAIAATVPVWKADACTQCNSCAFVCPHAAIRPVLAAGNELEGRPDTFNTIKAKGAGLGGLEYRIQVSPYDCTGCQLCVHACPDDALIDTPINQVIDIEDKHWEFARAIPEHAGLMDRASVKGSQFMPPLMEFSGACEGCGETSYVKLLTQMFGERLIIANATGCSSIWGGSAPSNPYTTNQEGMGPAWANSLFEDNAQFGLGIALATVARRKAVKDTVDEIIADLSVPVLPELRTKLGEWAAHWQDAESCHDLYKPLCTMLEAEHAKGNVHPKVERVFNSRDMIIKPSIWIIGGDGWAYDIGFGGLDHVMSTGEDVNILILDTEEYSNTGGQKSKSTPLGAVTKFAAGGKTRPKKDMGAIAMSYGDVYVASTCLNSNPAQVVKSFVEAEAHKGVSLIMAYAPCAMHGIEGGMCEAKEEAAAATEAGYWPLYRFNPNVMPESGKQRFQLDGKKTIKGDLEAFLHHENRFNILERSAPETAKALHTTLDALNHERLERLKHLAAGEGAEPIHGVRQINEMEAAKHKAEAEKADKDKPQSA